MKRIEFKSKVFEYVLTGYLILLLSWNLYALITENFKALIPITIIGILLTLILLKNEHAKVGVKIWAIILILSHGISFLAKLGKIFLGSEVSLSEITNKGISLIIGILIYFLNEKYVAVTVTKIDTKEKK